MYQLRRNLVLLLLVLVLTPITLVHAAVLEGFYRVEIPPREEQDRSMALREAFEIMVARQAGSGAVDHEAVLAAMQDPRNLMRRIAGIEEGGVRVEFEPASLRDLFTEAGLPVLGPNRPTVMLWAVEESGLGIEMLGQGSNWAAVLDEAAQNRAVALSLPLADLQDRALVDVQSIQKGEGETLRQASERYDAKAVLALSIDEGAQGPVLAWHWWLNEQSESGRISADSKAAAADQLMLLVADRVFGQYAVAPSSAAEVSTWEVIVEGIDSLDKFAALQRTFQQLGSRQMPSVLSIRGDEVRFGLEFPGTEAQLERLLALDQRLRRMPTPELEVLPVPEPLLEPQADQVADEGADDQSGPVGGESRMPESSEGAALAEPEPELQETEPTPNRMFFRWR
ncbi:DUF2066 domain-containing protein [Halopseudomonas salina]|uniref:DUF2066 domain-containing protein n=1 Tax=Halopseudomonas salina TaxID=1323744 RepID=A0ABQ1NX44_9GAMM|nr:DUF2066 domain-containing protein [Halopseudomonas salina]GGC86202.1 hypothetical protein GCM10007418_02470 [Halopseudomonas salina]